MTTITQDKTQGCDGRLMVDRSDEPGACKSGRARRRIPANGCSFLRIGQGACDIEGHASVLAEKASPAIRGHGKLAKLVEQLRHSAAEAPCPRFVPGGATLIAQSASVRRRNMGDAAPGEGRRRRMGPTRGLRQPATDPVGIDSERSLWRFPNRHRCQRPAPKGCTRRRR
jgi:hypothetical protein